MAALKIRHTQKAVIGFDEILGFIAQENPDAASKLEEHPREPPFPSTLFRAS